MDARRKLGTLFLSVGGVAALAVASLAAALSKAGIAGDPLVTYAVLAVAIVGAAIFALWQLVDRSLLRGLNALAGEARVIAHGTQSARVPLDRYAALTPLPQAINELGEKLALAKSDIDRAVASSTAEVRGADEAAFQPCCAICMKACWSAISTIRSCSTIRRR